MVNERNADQHSKALKQLPPLSPKQVQTLVAIMTSRTDQEAISKSPYNERYFYEIKPVLMKYKEWYLSKQLDETVTILKQGAPAAALNFVNKIDHKSPTISMEASKEVLDRIGITKDSNKGESPVNVQINNIIQKERDIYNLDE